MTHLKITLPTKITHRQIAHKNKITPTKIQMTHLKTTLQTKITHR